MAFVLAIESDPRQAGILKRMVRNQVPADLVVSDSKDSAVASIAGRLPDLILVSALMSPREEAELTEHLRGLEDADHLQTLTIPLLASRPARRAASGKVLRALSWRRAQALEGCDPSVFAEEIRGYLERARQVRAERALERRSEEGLTRPPAEPPAMPAEHAGTEEEHPLAAADPGAADVGAVPQPISHRLEVAGPEGGDAPAVSEPPPIPVLPETAIAAIVEAAAAATSTEPAVVGPAPVEPLLVQGDALETGAGPAESSPPPAAVDPHEDSEPVAPGLDDAGLASLGLPPAVEPPGDSIAEPIAAAAGEREEKPVPVAAREPEIGTEPAAAITATVAADPGPAVLRQQPAERAEPVETAERPVPLPPVPQEPPDLLKQDWEWIAGAIDALRQDGRRTRADRQRTPARPAAPALPPPRVERVAVRNPPPAPLPVEKVAATAPPSPPRAAASGKRGLRLVKTEKRREPRPKVAASPQAPAQPAMHHAPGPARPAPVDDEWGIHDPRECGFGALLARLDASAPDGPTAGETASAPRAVPPRAGGPRVTPLAIWAHVATDDRADGAEPDDLRGLLACLALPAGVAAVSYPTGCRVRRIRVAPRAHAGSRTGLEKKTVILSRRLLRRLRQRDAASGARLPA